MFNSDRDKIFLEIIFKLFSSDDRNKLIKYMPAREDEFFYEIRDVKKLFLFLNQHNGMSSPKSIV